jgi:hypothetical protein
VETATFLVFGDLHGRVLPAFRLALAWQAEHGTPLDGLLQVGDLGYFPDATRLDRATARHAADDPLELGAALVAERSPEADELFAEPGIPEAIWFTAGNHEDFDALAARATACEAVDFPVDAYDRVRCVRDGQVVNLAGGLRLGAIWGVDGAGPHCRRKLPERAYIRPRSLTDLAGRSLDVVLMHDAPADAAREHYGSDDLAAFFELTRPRFAFFGHYHGVGRRVAEGRFPHTELYHLEGLELRHRGGCAEPNSVGVLTWVGGRGHFEYVPAAWLRTFTRHNWRFARR